MSKALLDKVNVLLLWTLVPLIIAALFVAHCDCVRAYGPEDMMSAYLGIDPDSPETANIRCGKSDSDSDGRVLCNATIHRPGGDWETVAATCPISPAFILRNDLCIKT